MKQNIDIDITMPIELLIQKQNFLEKFAKHIVYVYIDHLKFLNDYVKAMEFAYGQCDDPIIYSRNRELPELETIIRADKDEKQKAIEFFKKEIVSMLAPQTIDFFKKVFANENEVKNEN